MEYNINWDALTAAWIALQIDNGESAKAMPGLSPRLAYYVKHDPISFTVNGITFESSYTIYIPNGIGGYTTVHFSTTTEALVTSGKTEEQLVQETVNAINDKILNVDPHFFDGLDNSFEYHIRIDNGSSIANAQGKGGKYLPGLASEYQDKGKKTIFMVRIAAEYFADSWDYSKNNLVPIYQVEATGFFSIFDKDGYKSQRFTLWEIIAHEFGHVIDNVKNINDFYTKFTAVQREEMAINRVNLLLQKYDMPIRIFTPFERLRYANLP